ncbi:MAG: universal stress family protein [bacterium]|nr:universal stress family protein [bacterium]
MRFSRILVPTDFSTGAARAADVAVGLAGAVGGRIELVHAYSPPVVMLPDGSTFVATPAELLRATERAETAMDEARRAVEAMAGGRVPVAGCTLVGNAIDEIVRLANSGDYDVVVMGTHGRSGIRRLLVGSVAEHVMRRATIPVITVREPAEARATAEAEPARPPHT